MRTIRALAAAAALAWVGTASGQEVTDSIKYGKNQFKANVVVTAENWDKVQFKDSSGAEGSIPADEVREILYGDAPSAIRSAHAYLKQRKYDEALKDFQAAAEDTSARKFWIGQQANFHAGEIYYRQGGIDPENYKRALEAYSKVEQAAKDGRYVPPAQTGIGMCHLRMGNAKASQGVFKRLADGAFGPRWAFRGRLGMVRTNLGDKKTALEAVKAAEKLVQEAKDDELRNEARLVVAEAHQAAEQYDAALKVFQDVSKEAPEEAMAIKAAAYNGVGDCYRAQKKIEEAKWAYLRVRCVYFEDTEETPRSMEGLAWCFKQLRDTKRLRETVDQIKKEYPGSLFGQKAELLLK